jgi:hypothetical protein
MERNHLEDECVNRAKYYNRGYGIDCENVNRFIWSRIDKIYDDSDKAI